MTTHNPEHGDPRAFPHVTNSGEPAGARKQPQTAERIQTWLISRITKELGVDPRDIDVRKHLARYGFDSLAKIAIVCDLEDLLGRRLPDTLVDDYPTIEALAGHLAEETHSGRASYAPPTKRG